MRPIETVIAALDAGLALLPRNLDSLRARIALAAIALQESEGIDRDQRESAGGRDVVQGPALGLWQNEKGGGVRGVLTHPASERLARIVCKARNVAPVPADVWAAMEYDDALAAAFARLLLLTLPDPLPVTSGEAFAQYVKAWRPGAFTRGNAEKRAALALKFRAHFATATEGLAP